MSSFSKAIRRALQSVQKVAGVEVTFRCDRGELTLVMVPALSEMQLLVEEGQTRYEAKDFLVPADQLAFDGELYEPTRGNSIVCGGRLFQVLTERNEPCFRYMDHGEQLMRIHTKHVDDEECA